jgi:hypothetical protein
MNGSIKLIKLVNDYKNTGAFYIIKIKPTKLIIVFDLRGVF